MRFVVYLALLAVLCWVGVALFQVVLRRLADRDRVRASALTDALSDLQRTRSQIDAARHYCQNAVIVNENDLTALSVLNLLDTEAAP